MAKRKIAIAIAAAALAGTCAIGGTLAWLTATDDVTNTFTFGNVDAKIDEATWDSEAGTANPEIRVDTNAYKVYPDSYAVKDPIITVTEGPAYVFAYLDDAKIEDLRAGNTQEPLITYGTLATDYDLDSVYTANGINTGWVDLGDGLYAWATGTAENLTLTEVTTNGKTAPLFDAIHVSDKAVKDDASKFENVSLDVRAFVVQSDNITTQEAVDLAKGQFALNG